MMDELRQIRTRREFMDNVLRNEKPVVVEFYSESCKDSKDFAPSMSELAKLYEDKIDFMKVDMQDAEDLRQQYEVDFTPTVMMFMGGQIVQTWIDDKEPTDYREAFEAALNDSMY